MGSEKRSADRNCQAFELVVFLIVVCAFLLLLAFPNTRAHEFGGISQLLREPGLDKLRSSDLFEFF